MNHNYLSLNKKRNIYYSLTFFKVKKYALCTFLLFVNGLLFLFLRKKLSFFCYVLLSQLACLVCLVFLVSLVFLISLVSLLLQGTQGIQRI